METSHRQILRASSIIGGASAVNILFGLIRVKVAALVLGPAGIGLIGLLQNLLQAASTLASFGLGSAGTRQIAEANERNDAARFAARRAMFWTALSLGLIGSGIFWSLRSIFAERLFEEPTLAGQIGWLSLGVALTVAANYQTALLTGLRRVGDIARISVLSSLLSAIVAIAALLLWGEQAVLLFVLATPVVSAATGYVYVRRIQQPARASQAEYRALAEQISMLLRLGAAFTVAGMAVLGGQLAVRILIQRHLGLPALGHFQAAWLISITYIAFILQAMSTDYFPRLTAAIGTPQTANRLVNEQTEVALLLGGPVLLVLLGLAPWVLQLLYSNAFSDAAYVLRWQIMGDLLKIASWPMGFILLASGHGRTYMLAETASVAVLVAVTALLLPVIGLEASGVAVLAMYLFYLPLMFLVARRTTGFAWPARVTALFLALGAGCAVTFLAAYVNPIAGAVIGCVSAAGFAALAVARLGDALPGPLGKLVRRQQR